MTNEPMTVETAQGLLAKLKATMADKKIWPDPVFDHLENDPDFASTKTEFEQEALAAWGDLFQFTCQAWDETFVPGADLPDKSGVQLCDAHESFHNCWRQSFIDSIEFVIDREENRIAQGFLYFMAGVMATSWKDYLSDLHDTKRQVAAE